MLLNGVGTEKDGAAATVYLERSAAVGNPFACYQLAKRVLSDEQSQPREVEKALAFLRQSVEAGNPYAQYFLGKLCEKGRHVPQNAAEAALRYLTAAAAQGNQYAQYTLGKLYLMGRDVPRDREAAVKWLERSAAQGKPGGERRNLTRCGAADKMEMPPGGGQKERCQ